VNCKCETLRRDERSPSPAQEILTALIARPRLQGLLRELKIFRFHDIEMSFKSTPRDCQPLKIETANELTIKNETVRPVKFDENFVGPRVLKDMHKKPMVQKPMG